MLLAMLLVTDNGGMASFAQFSSDATTGGTFDNIADFDYYVDTTPRASGGTNIEAGLARGREMLNASPSTAAFLILITDGDWNSGADPQVSTSIYPRLFDPYYAQIHVYLAVKYSGRPDWSGDETDDVKGWLFFVACRVYEPPFAKENVYLRAGVP